MSLYLRDEVLDSQAFADRAVEAVQQPTVQHVLAREITVQLIEPGFPDLIAGRPLISSAVRVAVTSKPFARVIRLVALHGHRLLFQRGGGNAVFDIADAGKVVSSALQNISPKLAREIPKQTEAVLLTLRKRSFASTTLRISEHRPAARVRAAARRAGDVRPGDRDRSRPPPRPDALPPSRSA